MFGNVLRLFKKKKKGKTLLFTTTKDDINLELIILLQKVKGPNTIKLKYKGFSIIKGLKPQLNLSITCKIGSCVS